MPSGLNTRTATTAPFDGTRDPRRLPVLERLCDRRSRTARPQPSLPPEVVQVVLREFPFLDETLKVPVVDAVVTAKVERRLVCLPTAHHDCRAVGDGTVVWAVGCRAGSGFSH